MNKEIGDDMKKRKNILDVLAITDTPIDLYKISNENELEYMILDIERVIRI